MSYSDFNRGHKWNPTDLWVSGEINNRISGVFYEDMMCSFPHADEIKSGVIEEYKGLDGDAVSVNRVERLESFDTVMKTLTAVLPQINPDAVIDKDEVWKWVWNDANNRGEPSKFFYVSPLMPHMKE